MFYYKISVKRNCQSFLSIWAQFHLSTDTKLQKQSNVYNQCARTSSVLHSLTLASVILVSCTLLCSNCTLTSMTLLFYYLSNFSTLIIVCFTCILKIYFHFYFHIYRYIFYFHINKFLFDRTIKFHIEIVKIASIGTRTRNCQSRVRRSAGLSIPGRDTDFMSCSVFICQLRSIYSALNSITISTITSILVLRNIM